MHVLIVEKTTFRGNKREEKETFVGNVSWKIMMDVEDFNLVMLGGGRPFRRIWGAIQVATVFSFCVA